MQLYVRQKVSYILQCYIRDRPPLNRLKPCHDPSRTTQLLITAGANTRRVPSSTTCFPDLAPQKGYRSYSYKALFEKSTSDSSHSSGRNRTDANCSAISVFVLKVSRDDPDSGSPHLIPSATSMDLRSKCWGVASANPETAMVERMMNAVLILRGAMTEVG